MKKSRISLFSSLLAILFALSVGTVSGQKASDATSWKAPPAADELVNPLTDQKQALKQGEKLYTAECVVCHGKYGNAETDIAKNLQQKPKNFTQEDFMKQSDGAIFWKLSEGRGLMQPFKTMLTDDEIWSVVVYVKTLAATEDD